jgi:DNA invertase Pin-like site-specific DNA recombinase
LGQKVALYCRVSTDDQSCERQERDLVAFAQRAGYEVVGIWKEVGSGVKTDRSERKKIMALAQDRRIEAIIVTELTRWGRSTIDLIQTLQQLQAWGVSLRAQTGLDFDLSTPQGKMMASVMAALAEFERDLLSERIRSGLATAKAKGRQIGRRVGQRVKADRVGPRVLELQKQGWTYRQIARKLNISKNTVTDIMKRYRQVEPQGEGGC